MNEQTITTLIVLAVAVVAFVSDRIPPPVVAAGDALALWFTGTVTFAQTLAGFGDPVVVYIARTVRGERRARRHGSHPMGGPAVDPPGR